MCSQNSESVMLRSNWRLTVAINKVDITKLIILHEFGIKVINFVFFLIMKKNILGFSYFLVFFSRSCSYIKTNYAQSKLFCFGCHQMTTCRIYDGYCFNYGITVLEKFVLAISKKSEITCIEDFFTTLLLQFICVLSELIGQKLLIWFFYFINIISFIANII